MSNLVPGIFPSHVHFHLGCQCLYHSLLCVKCSSLLSRAISSSQKRTLPKTEPPAKRSKVGLKEELITKEALIRAKLLHIEEWE